MEYYDPDTAPHLSIINLPIKLSKPELEKTINHQLGEVLYEDNDFSDGLMIRATRQSDIRLEVSAEKVVYKVPVSLWVRKDVLITNIEAQGVLRLEFETHYRIRPDWQLQTKTGLRKYEWVQPPVVKLGVGNLNITSVANRFIEQAKKQLSSSIDEQIKKLIDLKGEVRRAWFQLQQPILVSEPYQTWLLFNTDSVRLTPLQSADQNIETTVVITARPQLIMGKQPPTTTAKPLPHFEYVRSVPGKHIQLYPGSEITFAQAERIARQNLTGQTWSIGKRKVKVEEVSVFGKGNRLAIKTTLSGSYNGEVLLTGKPQYNERKNEIRLKEVDFEFSAKKSLMKTAGWLFKSPLKKTIEENLNFHLKENLLAAQKAIETRLENLQLAPGILLTGQLEELNVSHVYISTTGIHVKAGLKGNLMVEVRNFMAGN